MKVIHDLLAVHDLHFAHVYYCPNAEEDAHRRKPNIGMWLDLQNDFPGVVAEDCIMVGDKDLDIEFGKNIGCATARIISDMYPMTTEADYTVHDLNELASQLPL
jgi:D-glycero-D-manno-heptose 1,7-bisphosphate phosphatase